MQVMPYSTGLSTPLANFEANQNYKDTVDPSVMVRLYTLHLPPLPRRMPIWRCLSLQCLECHFGPVFMGIVRARTPVQVAFSIDDDPDNACFIAWTTTPW